MSVVDAEVSVEEAREADRLCALNTLAVTMAEAGSLKKCPRRKAN